LTVKEKEAQVLEMRTQNMKLQKERREQFSATTVMPSGMTRRNPTSPKSPTGGHVAIELPPLQSQTLSMIEQQDMSYLESRSHALQGIEATINELGTIYQQLAHMVAEQGDVVQRIDMNIEDMQMHVNRGQEQLLRYYRNVTSNRWLIIKIFGVLVAFIIFYALIFS